MSEIIKFRFSSPDFRRAFDLHRNELLGLGLAVLQEQRAQIFDREGAFNGRSKWKDLKSKQNLKTDKSGNANRQILSKRGDLRRSIAPAGTDGVTPKKGSNGILRVDGTKMVLGSMLIYAGIQNAGGVVQFPGTNKGFGDPKKFYPKMRRNGLGITIKPHPIRIPARPFLDFTAQDSNELVETIENRLKEIMNAAD